ncbi:MAG: hypothetical protein ACXADW_13530 [Candidatus Hodarchaeales archaeon]|jgi:hypothetical protein
MARRLTQQEKAMRDGKEIYRQWEDGLIPSNEAFNKTIFVLTQAIEKDEKFVAHVKYYTHGFKVWEIKKNGEDWRTVVFGRDDKWEGPSHTTFYINHVNQHAVIIDNGGWDIICFDLDYSPADILNACQQHLDWIKEDKELVKSETFMLENYDQLMEQCA